MIMFEEEITRVKKDGVEGTVESVLSSQITVGWDDGSFSFLFKKDRNVDWEVV